MNKDNVIVNARSSAGCFWFMGGLFTLGFLAALDPDIFPDDQWHSILTVVGIMTIWPILLGFVVGGLLKLNTILGPISPWGS